MSTISAQIWVILLTCSDFKNSSQIIMLTYAEFNFEFFCSIRNIFFLQHQQVWFEILGQNSNSANNNSAQSSTADFRWEQNNIQYKKGLPKFMQNSFKSFFNDFFGKAKKQSAVLHWFMFLQARPLVMDRIFEIRFWEVMRWMQVEKDFLLFSANFVISRRKSVLKMLWNLEKIIKKMARLRKTIPLLNLLLYYSTNFFALLYTSFRKSSIS